MPVPPKVVIACSVTIRPTAVPALEHRLAGEWKVEVRGKRVAHAANVVDIVPGRLQRNDPGLVEKAVDAASRSIAAQQYPRLADPVRHMPDRSENRRRRLCVVEV